MCPLIISVLPNETGLPNEQISYRIFDTSYNLVYYFKKSKSAFIDSQD